MFYHIVVDDASPCRKAVPNDTFVVQAQMGFTMKGAVTVNVWPTLVPKALLVVMQMDGPTPQLRTVAVDEAMASQGFTLADFTNPLQVATAVGG